MPRTSFHGWPCSIARCADVLHDAWAILVLREALYGVRRFDELRVNLSISRNILTRRLEALCGAGILERRPYQTRPERHEYVLTEKGRDLGGVLIAAMAWGDRWLSPEGPPVELVDLRTEQPIEPVVVDRRTGLPIDLARLRPRRGPGFPERFNTELAEKRFGPPPDAPGPS